MKSLRNPLSLHSKIRMLAIAPALVLLGPGAEARADTSAQKPVLSTSAVYQGTGGGDATAPDFFTVKVEPFDPALGTLVSFSVKWELEGTLAGTAAADVEQASLTGVLAGTFSFNGNPFAGGSGTGTTAGAPGDPISLSYSFPTYEHTFQATDAGQQYDPAFLAAVIGSAPFTLEAKRGAGSFASIAYAGVTDLQSGINARVTVTYQYTAAPATADPKLKITGVSHLPTTGSTSVAWASDSAATYSVDRSENLTDWETLGFGLPATPPSNTFTESRLSDSDHGFYRVRSRR